MHSDAPKSAYFALALGVLCIGTSAIFVKLAAVPGISSAFYRVFFAGLVLLPLQLAHKKRFLPPKKDLRLIVIGGLALAGDLALWNTAILLTSATAATLLSNNSPLWVGLGTMLIFQERLSTKYWLGLFTALSGMFIIVGGNALQELQFNSGDLLAIAASLMYAAYMLITQKARACTDTLSLNLLTMLIGSIVLLPTALLFKHPLVGFNSQTWLALLSLGLVPQVIGWLAINYAMGYLPAARVSVILLGQPVVTAILGILLLDEALTISLVVGGALVLTGIYLVNQRTQSKPEKAPNAYTQSA